MPGKLAGLPLRLPLTQWRGWFTRSTRARNGISERELAIRCLSLTRLQLLDNTNLPVGLGAPPFGSTLTANRSTVRTLELHVNRCRTGPAASDAKTPPLTGPGALGSNSQSW